jgi:ribonuclease HII
MDPWAFEKWAWRNGCARVAGVDEAGRGPLAGPVVAAAVVLPTDFDADGIGDSKSLSPRVREATFERILAQAKLGIGIVGPEVIDEINILRATHAAMRAALDILGAAYDFILVDGRPVPDLPGRSLAIVRGDSRSVSIGAASIVAKVTRDRIMLDLDREYPQYGFASHKGYCSRQHVEALERYGPCPCHRKSFAPVAERIARCCLPGLG